MNFRFPPEGGRAIPVEPMEREPDASQTIEPPIEANKAHAPVASTDHEADSRSNFSAFRDLYPIDLGPDERPQPAAHEQPVAAHEMADEAINRARFGEVGQLFADELDGRPHYFAELAASQPEQAKAINAAIREKIQLPDNEHEWSPEQQILVGHLREIFGRGNLDPMVFRQLVRGITVMTEDQTLEQQGEYTGPNNLIRGLCDETGLKFFPQFFKETPELREHIIAHEIGHLFYPYFTREREDGSNPIMAAYAHAKLPTRDREGAEWAVDGKYAERWREGSRERESEEFAETMADYFTSQSDYIMLRRRLARTGQDPDTFMEQLQDHQPGIDYFNTVMQRDDFHDLRDWVRHYDGLTDDERQRLGNKRFFALARETVALRHVVATTTKPGGAVHRDITEGDMDLFDSFMYGNEVMDMMPEPSMPAGGGFGRKAKSAAHPKNNFFAWLFGG